MSEIKGRQRGQVFYAQRRIKSEKQREQIRLAEKKKFDRSLIDKAKQELRNFLGQNVNEAGAEVVVEPVVTNNTINNNNRVEGAEGLQPGEGEDRRREVQARLDQLGRGVYQSDANATLDDAGASAKAKATDWWQPWM